MEPNQLAKQQDEEKKTVTEFELLFRFPKYEYNPISSQ